MNRPFRDHKKKFARIDRKKSAPTDAAQLERRARRRHLLKIAGTTFSVGILLLSLVVLVRTFSTISYWDLRAAIQATSSHQITLAFLFTATSYIALTGYDWVALRQLKLRVRYTTTAIASFASFSVAFTLGFPLFTAGTVRYWIYSQAGVSAAKVASLTVIAGVSFWLGMVLIIGVSFLVRPAAIASVDHLQPWINFLIGFAATGTLFAYLFWVGRERRRTQIHGLKLELPGLGLTTSQLVLGVADLCSAAGVLYVLLPAGHGVDFLTFAATYVLACLLGIASNVPGGIGAFEATMLNAVPAPSVESMLASLLLFRVIYYLVPFVLALALLGAHESVRRWASLREAMNDPSDENDIT
ncbi:MAG TPA: YbhN family protein [Beijerinckiaceae bacterium]|nr:YbhN family protein [Beijerinckiaceae bacterium]